MAQTSEPANFANQQDDVNQAAPSSEEDEPTQVPSSLEQDDYENSSHVNGLLQQEKLQQPRIQAQVPTAHPHRQVYIIWLVLIYSTMFITAWVILIISSKRPFGRASYGCFDNANYCQWSSEKLQAQDRRTIRYISNAQTLLSTVSLLTIPLTSAVCAAAVVPWLQSSGKDMSLRQVITLADRGWKSPYTYSRLLSPTGWRRYGSSFIALAILLHALGASLSPAISQLSSLTVVKVPTAAPYTTSVAQLIGWSDLFNQYGIDDQTAILKLRQDLKSAAPRQIQPRLWVPQRMNCTALDADVISPDQLTLANQCTSGGPTLLALSTEPEAWISQLPYGFSTGVKTAQHLPRVNTSVTVELIDGLPASCASSEAAVLMNYDGSATGVGHTGYQWYIRVCIPDYSATTPFNNIGDAQTVIENAYLDLSTQKQVHDSEPLHTITKITMSTTIGYFELPNYSNNIVPGGLLRNYTQTGLIFKRQGWQASDLTLTANSTQTQPKLETRPNPGPLLKVIYALFGNGSLPSTYLSGAPIHTGDYPSYLASGTPCLDLVPLASLVRAFSPYNSSEYVPTCLDFWNLEEGDQMHSFISQFSIPPVALERVLRAAAYISHDNWLSNSGSTGTLNIDYDAGTDLQKPGMTNGAILGLSMAIGLFLICLLILAVYAGGARTWTSGLDAYALLRMGAELGGEILPFLLVKEESGVVELDELRGWVGATDVEGAAGVGKIGRNGRPREVLKVLAMEGTGLKRKVVERVTSEGRYVSYPGMPERRMFEVVCDWCDGVCGLGGMRRTRAGRKVKKARMAVGQWLDGWTVVRWYRRWRDETEEEDSGGDRTRTRNGESHRDMAVREV